MGHFGYERAMELIRKRFYCRQMNDYIKEFVSKICKCANGRRWIRLAQAPQKCIASATPMEQVGTDFLHLDTLIGGSQYLLLIADHFTKYNQVYPIVKKDAKNLACDLECQEWTNESIYHLDTKKLRKEVTWKNYINRLLRPTVRQKILIGDMLHISVCMDGNQGYPLIFYCHQLLMLVNTIYIQS